MRPRAICQCVAFELELGELAPRDRLVRIDRDRAGQRAMHRLGVAELVRHARELHEVAAQAGRLRRRLHELAQDRRELDDRPGVPAQLDEREPGVVVRGVEHARLAVELLRALGVAERDAEVRRVGEPARADVRGDRKVRHRRTAQHRGAMRSVDRRAPRRLDEHAHAALEVAAIAQQHREPVGGLGEIRVVGARALEQVLRLVPVRVARDLGGAVQHLRARLWVAAGVGARLALERDERLVLEPAEPHGDARERLEHLGAVGDQLVALAVGVTRGRHVVELALVDHGHLAIQLRLLLHGHVVRAPLQEVDQHRPLAGRAVELLEPVVGDLVGGRQQENALERVGGLVAVARVLPRLRDAEQARGVRLVGAVEKDRHAVEGNSPHRSVTSASRRSGAMSAISGASANADVRTTRARSASPRVSSSSARVRRSPARSALFSACSTRASCCETIRWPSVSNEALAALAVARSTALRSRVASIPGNSCRSTRTMMSTWPAMPPLTARRRSYDELLTGRTVPRPMLD